MNGKEEKRPFEVTIGMETYDGYETRKHTMHGSSMTEIIRMVQRDYSLEECVDWRIKIRECME